MDKTKKLLDIINHWSEVEEWVNNYCIITKKKLVQQIMKIYFL